jgi:two-component system, chemotaxis family, chemotaxis protein CheY
MTVTALVVDDSETLRIALTGLLEEGGLKVLQAENGAQGVEVWQAENANINLVITDYNMPEMDGITMVRKIRSLPNGADVLVFMLTTESSPDLKTLGKEVGVKAWITKPYNGEKVLLAIKKLTGA